MINTHSQSFYAKMRRTLIINLVSICAITQYVYASDNNVDTNEFWLTTKVTIAVEEDSTNNVRGNSGEAHAPSIVDLAWAGDPDAQYQVGLSFEHSANPNKDTKFNAFSWFRAAARQKHKEAQFKMGLAYETGLWVKKHPATAAWWYTKSAKQNYAPAQNNLAFYFETKQKDIDYARYMYRMAAKQRISNTNPSEVNAAIMTGAFNLKRLSKKPAHINIQQRLLKRKRTYTIGHADSSNSDDIGSYTDNMLGLVS